MLLLCFFTNQQIIEVQVVELQWIAASRACITTMLRHSLQTQLLLRVILLTWKERGRQVTAKPSRLDLVSDLFSYVSFVC